MPANKKNIFIFMYLNVLESNFPLLLGLAYVEHLLDAAQEGHPDTFFSLSGTLSPPPPPPFTLSSLIQHDHSLLISPHTDFIISSPHIFE